MSDTPVIYENPKHPLPERAKYIFWCHVSFGVYASEHLPAMYDTGFRIVSGDHWEVSDIYGQPGTHWQESLRRLVHLHEEAYYVPENPHTDDEGFLLHDGGPMPEWCKGKRVETRRFHMSLFETCDAEEIPWDRTAAYRIVGEQEEKGDDRVSGLFQHHQDIQRSLTDDERRHRNELAARALTPVPGMNEWMHDVLREARRFEYRKAALQGLSGNTHFSDLDAMEHAKKARLLGDAMFACEKPE